MAMRRNKGLCTQRRLRLGCGEPGAETRGSVVSAAHGRAACSVIIIKPLKGREK